MGTSGTCVFRACCTLPVFVQYCRYSHSALSRRMWVSVWLECTNSNSFQRLPCGDWDWKEFEGHPVDAVSSVTRCGSEARGSCPPFGQAIAGQPGNCPGRRRQGRGEKRQEERKTGKGQNKNPDFKSWLFFFFSFSFVPFREKNPFHCLSSLKVISSMGRGKPASCIFPETGLWVYIKTKKPNDYWWVLGTSVFRKQHWPCLPRWRRVLELSCPHSSSSCVWVQNILSGSMRTHRVLPHRCSQQQCLLGSC